MNVCCRYDKLINPRELVEHPLNNNIHPDKQLDLLYEIVKSNGWRNPVVVSNRSGYVIKGHGRLQMALKCKLDNIPVEFQDYDSEALEYADMIADNKISELSKLDKKRTLDIFEKIDTGELESLNITGYTDKEIEKLFSADNIFDDKPEVEFTAELLEAHNYLVFYFDNELDWNVIKDLFNIGTVKCLDAKQGYERSGLGRVISGKKLLEKVK